MRNSLELDNLAVFEEVPTCGVITRGGGSMIIRYHESAKNDATCEEPLVSKDKIEAWLRHALAADGIGTAATIDTTSCTRPSSYVLYHAARAHRGFILGQHIVAAIKAACAIARRAYVRYRQHQKTKATRDVLGQLDNRTLRDLGFDRSEIGSIAAELTGEAEYTRVRALPTPAPKQVLFHAISG